MTTKKRPKFLRRKNQAYSKLGKRRKNKQVWRRPTGRDNKMREKRKGVPLTVSIGYRTDKIARGMLSEKVPVCILNVSQLKKIRENEIPVLANVGKKNKIEIAKEAEKMKIKIYNLNSKKFLKENELKNKKKNSEGKK
jgi:large subunit ribosomal protein L32e